MRKACGYGLTIIGGAVGTVCAGVATRQLAGGVERGYSAVMLSAALGCLALALLVLLHGRQMVLNELRKTSPGPTDD